MAMGVQEAAPFEKAQGTADGHDLVAELRLRLNCVWRYGECIAEAMGNPRVQQLWREIQGQELATIGRLKRRIFEYMDQGVFLPGL